ncbi:MAG TPA: glycosyltransferase family 1 protein [Pyrinomonadaceae bacterium]|nr:glycosyltransferase family 1 protein [Pyrinomonadaceae bacterium]
MRIAIDAHSVGTGLGGNESYATNLIEALAEIDSINQYTIYVTKPSARSRFENRWPNFSVRSTLPHTPLIRIPLTLSRELRRRPVDVLHVQFTSPPLAPCPVVVSVHDLSFEHLPQTFKRRSRMQLRMTARRSARLAAQVLTLSEYVRRDVIQTYGIQPEKITAIPIAAADHFSRVDDRGELQRIRQKYGIEGEYVLSVGAIQPRKNLPRLLEAYSFLRRSRPDVKLPELILVGKAAWLYDETLRRISELGLVDSVKLAGYVPEQDLAALYSGAHCFIYPSYFEGFGLPPLEAMKCGAPVIVGNQTSLPEVVGDAAILVDPFSVDDIAAAILKVITNSTVRASLRAAGLARAKLFDWKETARQTLAVYEKAAGQRR